ncbi:MAG: HD domain-containing protein, partial [Defluviitaleaceae bacterium]|nr:HD domain-containing protein [Defluviitaleaceae bacterium]
VPKSNIRLIATSAIREAANKHYILDQIRLKTGCDVYILDEQEEKLNVFKTSMRLMGADEVPSLLVLVGSGNSGFSIVEDGRIPFYQNIRTGPHRVSELFDELSRHSKEYHVIVNEFVQTFLNKRDVDLPRKVSRLVLSGGDINAIKHLCGKIGANGIYRICRTDFTKLYERVKNLSTESITRELDIPTYRAQMLIPALCIVGSFFDLAGTDEAEALPVYLNESVAYEILYPDHAKNTDKAFYRNTLLCVKSIADKYEVQHSHSDLLDRFAMKIFDKIRKLHGMGARERALLQCACYLHDVGKYIGATDHAVNSYNIVRSLDILGFNQQEMRILAAICLIHSTTNPDKYNQFHHMPDGEKTVTAKLAAILRLADALDRGDSQKIKDIEVTLDGENLTILATANKNIELEKWAFEIKGNFFNEVFGTKAVLKVKIK